jgi:acyl-CoA synthetase (AMP-forming)/AMP-acid ligase II
MNTIESLLSTANNRRLISYQGQTETQITFARRVDALFSQIKKIAELKDPQFVIIKEKNPITFYALLMALWKNGNRVIMPNRDFYVDAKTITYFKYIVDCQDMQVHVTANSNFDRIEIPDGDVIVFSSGSTGIPKGILHEHVHFLANAKAVADRIREASAVSLTFLKPYLVSALSHLLVHFMTNSHLCFEDYEKVHTCGKHYINQSDIGIVGSPIHLTSALRFIPLQAKPHLFFSSGDFLSTVTIVRILKTFPETVIYNVYGLAELAGRFFINRIDSTTPATHYETIGTAIKGADYRVENNQLVVNSDFLFKGYIQSGRFIPAINWHPSQDLVKQYDHGLFLIGRVNDEIKILGNKVSLKHIENRIKRTIDIDVAVVVASAHPVFGNILSLVIDGSNNLQRTALIRKLRAHLKPYEIPHQFFTMDEIPYTQSMKIDRAAIVDRLDSLEAIV